MYSLVLMVALSGGAEAPAFGHCCGCCGCYSCCGCHGCHGCCGCWGCHGCHGCHGCCGCHGFFSHCHGCCGCYSCCGCCGCCGCYGCYGCNGCCGCNGCYSYGCAGCNGGAAPAVEKKEQKKDDDNDDDQAQQVKANTARVIVSLPADAKLTINGQATKSTSAKRVFESPTLEKGKTYSYTFKATVVRDGRTVSAERKIQLKAGERKPVSFDFETSSVALK
jgi:uncharacterized protein (TIGR03000 family)